MASPNKQALDQNLFFIGGLVTLVLTISAILNLSSTNSYLSIALFLPIPLYFLYLSFFKFKNFLESLFNHDQKPQSYFGEFTIKEFLSQSNWDFLITIILFAFAVSAILLKVSLQILK